MSRCNCCAFSYLCAGSFASILSRIGLQWTGMGRSRVGQSGNNWYRIALAVSIAVPFWKGWLQESISQSTMPREKMSEAGVVNLAPSCSGDMYGIVPDTSKSCVEVDSCTVTSSGDLSNLPYTTVATPKSSSLIRPSSVEDVRGLNVAMHYPFSMSGGQGIGKLEAEIKYFWGCQLRIHELPDFLPAKQLRHDELAAVLFTYFMDGAYIG